MNEIDALFRDVRQYFVYRPDLEGFNKPDDWRSQAAHIGSPYYGDCDDLAMTAADLAVQRGIDPARVRVALCLTEVGQWCAEPPPYDHMVCLIDDEGDGYTMALDNRQRRVERWDRLGYRWHSAMRLSERGVWRDMTGQPPVEIAQPVAPVAPVPPVAPMVAATANELRLARVDARLAERGDLLSTVTGHSRKTIAEAYTDALAKRTIGG